MFEPNFVESEPNHFTFKICKCVFLSKYLVEDKLTSYPMK